MLAYILKHGIIIIFLLIITIIIFLFNKKIYSYAAPGFFPLIFNFAASGLPQPNYYYHFTTFKLRAQVIRSHCYVPTHTEDYQRSLHIYFPTVTFYFQPHYPRLLVSFFSRMILFNQFTTRNPTGLKLQEGTK